MSGLGGVVMEVGWQTRSTGFQFLAVVIQKVVGPAQLSIVSYQQRCLPVARSDFCDRDESGKAREMRADMCGWREPGGR